MRRICALQYVLKCDLRTTVMCTESKASLPLSCLVFVESQVCKNIQGNFVQPPSICLKQFYRISTKESFNLSSNTSQTQIYYLNQHNPWILQADREFLHGEFNLCLGNLCSHVSLSLIPWRPNRGLLSLSRNLTICLVLKWRHSRILKDSVKIHQT